MLGAHNHIGRAEEGVGTGGENGYGIAVGGDKIKLCTGGTADPVALLGLDALDEVQLVQIINKALGILGDFEHPLALFLADNGSSAALANAVYDLFIGEDALAAGAPVNGHLALIGKTLLEKLEEYPLGPLEISGVGGIHTAVPVKAEAQHLKLLCEVGNVIAGNICGMEMVLYRIVFGGQTECIIADGEKNIVAVHTALSGNNVHSGVGAGMSNVETCGGRIRELNESVELGLITAGDSFIALVLKPVLLPFLFDRGKIVFHVTSSFFIFSVREHDGGNIYLLGVGPKALKIIELSGLIHKDMDNNAAEVYEHPAAGAVALTVEGIFSLCLQNGLNLIGHSLYLGGGVGGADNKIICEYGDIGGAQKLDILCLLAVKGGNDNFSYLFGCHHIYHCP